MSDKLWPRVSIFLDGTKDRIEFGEENYVAPYEMLLLLALYRLSTPNQIHCEMEKFFGFPKSKIRNTKMSSDRESVEWGFAYINKHWAFLNFQAAMKIFQSPVAKCYIVGTFLCNWRTCYYGYQTMRFLMWKRQHDNRWIFGTNWLGVLHLLCPYYS